MAKAKTVMRKDGKTGLGVNVKSELLDLLLVDAREFSKTKDGIVEALLTEHFRLKKSARAMFYRSVPKKVFGRPVR